LQTSALGWTVWTHSTAPFRHTVMPLAQTPGKPVLHAAPPPGLPLSMSPSQSSSTPLQVSAWGKTWPVHWAPH
jgi:hypothetical protein